MKIGKKELRHFFLDRRCRMAENKVKEESRVICSRLATVPELIAAPAVACYSAFDNEVELEHLMAELGQQGKKLSLPRYDKKRGCYEMAEINNVENDTRRGGYNIMEPLPECNSITPALAGSEKMVWLVPGVAFDPTGQRLGRGAGWYDRLLAESEGFLIGVAYDWQIATVIPHEPHDQRMDMVVSEKRMLRISVRSH